MQTELATYITACDAISANSVGNFKQSQVSPHDAEHWLRGNHSHPNHLNNRAMNRITIAHSTSGCCCVYCLDFLKAVATGRIKADALSSHRILRGLIFLAIERYWSACKHANKI